MPELPEVETTRRGIEPYLLNKTLKRLVIRERQLRWPIPNRLNQLLANSEFTEINRRGKYLLLKTAKGHLIAHLGMSGSYSVLNQDRPADKHEHFDLVMTNGTIVRYRDPRKFGALLFTNQPIEEHPLLAHLGPEPLSAHFNPDYFYAALQKRKVAIKLAIMDSKLVVGVGNIYANEALFQAGIHPKRSSKRISKTRASALCEAIKVILGAAIKQGGTTLRDFSGSDGKPGYFKQVLNVYGRGGENCMICNSTLKEIRIANRSTVYCSTCQH